jgi:excinuclease UvrABC nuclease subunit
MNEKIQAVLNSLPHKPGIYLMKDAGGTVIYVGKAISLYNRVRSYFQESTDLSPKNRSMVAKVADIEFLVVRNEVEALVLESNYIKQYRPKYNVLLRDDKNYPYIKVALTEDFPRVYRVRSYQRDGNRYFGPYTAATTPATGHRRVRASRLPVGNKNCCRVPVRNTSFIVVWPLASAMPRVRNMMRSFSRSSSSLRASTTRC